MSEKLLIRNQYACFLCTGWMFQVRLRSTAWSGHPFLLVSSHLTSLPQLFFSVYSFIAIHCLFLLLVPHSSFLICSAPSGSCSLIYFYRAAWKESRQEQKRNQQPFLSSQSPLWILLLSDCLVFLVFNEFSSVSHRFPKCFHSSPSVLFDPLHLFLYLNFYFRLFFFFFSFLQLCPDSLSLTPTTICSFSSLIMALLSSLVFTGQSEEVHGPDPAQSGGQSVQVLGKRLRSKLPRQWHWW